MLRLFNVRLIFRDFSRKSRMPKLQDRFENGFMTATTLFNARVLKIELVSLFWKCRLTLQNSKYVHFNTYENSGRFGTGGFKTLFFYLKILFLFKNS